jgi:UDP-N-acetylmuramyl pentapeptide synthase
VAAEISELAVFLGDSRHYAMKAALAGGMSADCVRGFDSVKEAVEFLKSELRSGDLVLLKGRSCDHLERIYLAQLGPVGCWKVKCRERTLCDMCKHLRPEEKMA